MAVDQKTVEQEEMLARKMAELGLGPDDVESACEECGKALSTVEVLNCLTNQDVGAFVCSRHFAEYVASNSASCDAVYCADCAVFTAKYPNMTVGEAQECLCGKCYPIWNQAEPSAIDNQPINPIVETITKESNTMATQSFNPQAFLASLANNAPIATVRSAVAQQTSAIKAQSAALPAPKPARAPLEPVPQHYVELAKLMGPKIGQVHAGLLTQKRNKQADKEYVAKQFAKNAAWKPYAGNGLHSKFDGFVSFVCALASKAIKAKGGNDVAFSFSDGVLITRALVELKVIEQHPTPHGYTVYMFGTAPAKSEHRSETANKALDAWGITF